jgi:phage FluMu protein Com
MARRGRCRCGLILTFQQGPHGYKVRCPGCKAVVRLSVDESAPAPAGIMAFCVCGQMVELDGPNPAVCPHCGSLVLPQKGAAARLPDEEEFAETEMMDALDAEWLRNLKQGPKP